MFELASSSGVEEIEKRGDTVSLMHYRSTRGQEKQKDGSSAHLGRPFSELNLLSLFSLSLVFHKSSDLTPLKASFKRDDEGV